MFYKIVNIILKEIKDVLAIILFGSYARFFKGRDIDLIIVTSKNMKEKEFEIKKRLEKEFNYKYVFDVHILDLETFKKCLEPPNFLSGIFLGYIVLYDKINIKEIIESKRRDYGYIFVDRYGIWHI